MKIHLTFFSLCVAVLIVACSKSDDTAPPPNDPAPVITVNKSSLLIGAIAGNTDSFTLQSNVAWQLSLSAGANWLKLNTVQGNAGTHVIKIDVLSASTNPQTATITAVASGSTKILASIAVTQKAYNFEWNKLYGGTSLDMGVAMAIKTDGSLLVAGSTASVDGDVSSNHGAQDFWVINTDISGNKLWEKSYGGTGYDNATSIVATNDGGFYIGGYSSSNDGDVTDNNGGNDGVIIKCNSVGDTLWTRIFGDIGDEYINAITATTDGGVVVTGYTTGATLDGHTSYGYIDVFAAKFDAGGTKLWSKMLGGFADDFSYAITATTGGGVAITGNTMSTDGDVTGNHGNLDMWVIKLDVNGNKVWSKALGGSMAETGYAIKADETGNIYAAGFTTSSDGDINLPVTGMADAWVIKLNADGNLLWQKKMGGTDEEVFNALAISQEGGVLIAGYSKSANGNLSENKGSFDGWILQLDSQGNSIWQRSVGGSSMDNLYAITTTTDKRILIAGSTSSNDGDLQGSHGGNDIWLMSFK